jgi:pectin methylesterase-like acyl-CoA thioesterase
MEQGMCWKSISRYVCFVALFSASGLLSVSSVKAADMTITSVFPANNAVEVCADTKLWVTFGTTPIVATSGNLQICKVSDDSVVYQLDLQTLPVDTYGHIAAGWPTAYRITLNGLTINYEPFGVSGKTVEIYPSVRLAYNTAYYVKMTAGFCADANGNTSPAINDTATWRFTTKATAPTADRDYVVALDGSGDFCTLQGAVDAVTNNDANRTLIRIKNGTYREIVNIPSSKINMTWLGEDTNTTIIAGYNRELFNSGTANRVMIKNYGNAFRMYNMTLRNTAPDNSGQAETIRLNALQCLAKNCKYRSYQDTVLVNAGTAYFANCYIEGDTDYIWGAGTAYFDKCEMRSLTSSTSYITQPRAAQDVNGLILVDCNLTSPPGIIGVYLGRTTNNSYPYSQSVYLNCIMSGSVVYPVGWKFSSSDTDFSNYRFWEYKSVNQSGALIDVSHRIDPGSRQITDDNEAAMLRDVNYIFKPSWNPKTLPDLPTFSWEPSPADGTVAVPPEGTTLVWAAGAEATSHMVYFGTANPPDFAVEQNNTSFATGVMLPNTNYYWRIDEKNSNGETAGAVWSFTTKKYLCTGPIVSDLDSDCEVDFLDYAPLAYVWAGNLSGIAQFAADWLICNREPAGECWQ